MTHRLARKSSGILKAMTMSKKSFNNSDRKHHHNNGQPPEDNSLYHLPADMSFLRNSRRHDDAVMYRYIVGKSVGLIGCPFSGGQAKDGVDQGPLKIIDEYGLIDQLADLGWEVEFDGYFDPSSFRLKSDPDIGALKNPRYVAGVTEALSKAVQSHVDRGQLALTLGGDHSLAMGTVSGSFSVYPNTVLFWIDAHADINTPKTTVSGNIHGCPVSFLMGLAGEVPGYEWLRPCLRPDRIVYIGLRDIEEPEKKILENFGIKAYSMYDIDEYGIGQVMKMALDHVNPKRNRPIHLSFDVDALDPSVAPSTGTPVRGGLTFREGHYICEFLHKTGLLIAVDLMEVNPTLENEACIEQTVTVGCSLVRSCLGETLL